jgi:hypothetical protein
MKKNALMLSGIVIMGTHLLCPASTRAQGCVLLRQTSPMFGTTGSPDQEVGTWNITFTGRASTADTHYSGTVEQVQRHIDGTYVVNEQHSITTTINYQFSPRISLNAAIPFIEASWGIPSPRSAGQAARANENARGVGDITTLARVALFAPLSGRTWNLMLGGGIKFPTGNNEAVDMYPDGNGNNNAERYVDISAQPGDGGWGIIMDVQGYKALGRFLPFGSGTWLMNPQDTGGPSRGNLATTTTPTSVNSITDQFVFRAGTSFSVTRTIAVSIAWRMEGVPRYDLIGRSDGFRRPGVEMYWEPGITISSSRHTISLNVPIGYYFNRFPNPYTGAPGDATFPKAVAIGTYSVRLGSNTHMVHPPATDQPPAGNPLTPRLETDDQGQQ